MFTKRSGTTDLGKDYENSIVSYLVLRLIKNSKIKDFQVWANDENFGAFDDVLVNIKYDDESEEKYALQLKHSANKKRRLNLSSMGEDKGDFSIKKYFESFKKCKVKFSNYKFILWTNLKFETSKDPRIKSKTIKIKLDEEEFFEVDMVECEAHPLLNTSTSTKCCYKFEIVESTSQSTKIEEYRDFFKCFFLYVNQIGVDQLKIETPNTFSDLFSCEKSVSNPYLNFVTQWSMREGLKEKLDKTMMERVIALLLLDGQIHSFSFDGCVTKKARILQEAITRFNVTLFKKESSKKIKKLWSNSKEEQNDVRKINTTLKQYQISSMYCSDINKLGDEECTKLLWAGGHLPIIVDDNPKTREAIALCKDRNFILIVDPKSEKLENLVAFTRLSDLRRHENEFKNITRNTILSLLDERKTLEELIKEDEEFGNIITTDDLLEMIEQSYEVKQTKEELPSVYVDRHLSKTIIDFKFLQAADKDTVILVSNVEDEKAYFKDFNLIHVDDTQATGNSLQHSLKRRDLFYTTDPCSQQDFNSFCKKYEKEYKKFHHFVWQKHKLEWIKSFGDISELEQYRLDNDDHIEEETLCEADFQNNIHLITADSGMGKTIFLKNLGNNLISKYLVVMVTPSDIFQFFQEKENSIEFENFILNVRYNEYTKIDQQILKILIKSGKIVYFWDALEEIRDEDRLRIQDLIVSFSRKVKLQFITNRPHLKKELEIKFSALSRTILPFSEEQQKQYIKDRLMSVLDGDIEIIIKEFLQNIAVISHNDILSIPQQIFMATELFRLDPKKFVDLFNKTFTLVELYRHFIEEKFNLYYREKSDISGDNYNLKLILQEFKNNRIRNYKAAALKSLFDDSFLQQLKLECGEFLTKIRHQGDKLGLIKEVTLDLRPIFVHTSYSDYFAAKYLEENCKSIADLRDVIFRQRHTNVRFFFDMLLAKDSPAHNAVLYKNVEYLKQCGNELYCKDSEGRNVLQLACSWGERYPLLKVPDLTTINDLMGYFTREENRLYVEMLEYLAEKLDPEETDTLFDMNSFSYAEKCECLYTVAMLLNKTKTCLEDKITVCSTLYYAIRFGYDNVIDIFDDVPYVRNLFGNTFIHMAAENGRTIYLSKLLEKNQYKIHINSSDDLRTATALHLAALNGHETCVDLIIQRNGNVNATTVEGATPLHHASKNGYYSTVDLLIRSNGNVNANDNNGVTPLHYASLNGYDRTVSVLIKSGGDVNVTANNGVTPLHCASENGHTSTAGLLLKFGGDVNATDNEGWTPLHYASRYSSTTDLLIKSGGNVNATDNDKWTPLHYASRDGHDSTADLLIKFGAEVNATDNYKCTPLQRASMNCHDSIVDLLTKAGADVNVIDNDGITALYRASIKGHHRIVDILVKAGARVDFRDKDNTTPLIEACCYGHYKVVELLTKAGAEVNAVDNNNLTPIGSAFYNKHNETVQVLIEGGADQSLIRESTTPLYAFCSLGYAEEVQLFIKMGADIEIVESNGWRPIHVACLKGYDEVVQILLESGADVNAVTANGQTPIQIAIDNGHVEVMQRILKHCIVMLSGLGNERT